MVATTLHWSEHKNARLGPFLINGVAWIVGHESGNLMLAKSSDAGTTWTRVNPQVVHFVQGLDAQPRGTDIVIAMRDGTNIYVLVFDTVTESVTSTSAGVACSTNISGTYPLAVSPRSDGSTVVVHQASPEKIMGTDYRRAAISQWMPRPNWNDTWSTFIIGADTQNIDARGVMLGDDDRSFCFYTLHGSSGLRCRTYDAAGGISAEHIPATMVSGSGYYAQGGPVKRGTDIYFPHQSTARIARMPSNVDVPDINSGASWQVNSDAIDTTTANGGAMAVDNDGNLHAFFVKSSDRDIYKVEDGGTETWTPYTNFLPGTITGVSTGMLSATTLGLMYEDGGVVYVEPIALAAPPPEITASVEINSTASIELTYTKEESADAAESIVINNTATVDLAYSIEERAAASLSIDSSADVALDAAKSIRTDATINNTSHIDIIYGTGISISAALTLNSTADITTSGSKAAGVDVAIDSDHTESVRVSKAVGNDLALTTESFITTTGIKDSTPALSLDSVADLAADGSKDSTPVVVFDTEHTMDVDVSKGTSTDVQFNTESGIMLVYAGASGVYASLSFDTVGDVAVNGVKSIESDLSVNSTSAITISGDPAEFISASLSIDSTAGVELAGQKDLGATLSIDSEAEFLIFLLRDWPAIFINVLEAARQSITPAAAARQQVKPAEGARVLVTPGAAGRITVTTIPAGRITYTPAVGARVSVVPGPASRTTVTPGPAQQEQVDFG